MNFMKKQYALFSIVIIMVSCSEKPKSDPEISATTPIEGTWKLLTGTIIEKGDTAITDYTKNKSFAFCFSVA